MKRVRNMTHFNAKLRAGVLLCCVAALAQADGGAPRLSALTDAQLRSVSTPMMAPSARPLPPRLSNRSLSLFPLHGLASEAGNTKMGVLLFPLVGLLNADVTVRDVVVSAPHVNADGSLNLALPVSIGELDVQAIRAGVNDSANFGALQVRGIDMSRTVITIMPTSTPTR